MANVRITEFPGLGNGNQADIQAVATPPTAEQPGITTSGASQQSAPFNDNTRIVRVHTDGIIAIRVGGTNPVAVAGTSARMGIGQTEYYSVSPGDRLAVIDDA